MYSQPKSLPILFVAEFIERFSYWGMQSLLVLYLIKNLSLPSDKAYIIYGIFSAFAFGLTIVGGFIADVMLGFRKALIIGSLFAIAGNICLALPNLKSIYTGLTLIICGVALFTPNNSNLLGSFYERYDKNRDKGFTIFYIGTNLGGLLGPVFYGVLSVNYGWHAGFLVSAIVLALWLAIFLLKNDIFVGKGLPPSNSYTIFGLNLKYLFYPFITISAFLIWFLIQNINFASGLLSCVGVIALIFLLNISLRSPNEERNSILLLLAMMFFCLLFFANELQVNSSLLLFTEQHVNREVFGWKIPTNTFAALEPLAIVIFAPLLSQLWSLLGKMEPSVTMKLALGFILEAVSFFVFAGAADSITHIGQQASIFWLLIGNLLLGVGEVCLMPTIISSITRLAPLKLKGTMMGALYLAISFSSYFSGLIATLTINQTTNAVLATNYAYVYRHIGFFALSIAVICLLFFGLMRRFQYD